MSQHYDNHNSKEIKSHRKGLGNTKLGRRATLMIFIDF